MADTIKAKQNGKTRAQLILILMQAYGRPVTAREIMNIVYPGNKNESQISDELRYMFQQGKVIRTGTPQQYFYELLDKKKRNYFYVSQQSQLWWLRLFICGITVMALGSFGLTSGRM